MWNYKFILSVVFFISVQISGIQYKLHKQYFTNDVENLIGFLSYNKKSYAFLISMLINCVMILGSCTYLIYSQFFNPSSKDINFLIESLKQYNPFVDLIIINIYELRLITTQLDCFFFLYQIIFCFYFKSLLNLCIHNFKNDILNNSNDLLQNFKQNKSRYVP